MLPASFKKLATVVFGNVIRACIQQSSVVVVNIPSDVEAGSATGAQFESSEYSRLLHLVWAKLVITRGPTRSQAEAWRGKAKAATLVRRRVVV
jgi:hypothetical protein